MSTTPAPAPTPTPTETDSRLEENLDPVATPCLAEDGSFCGLVYNWTGNEALSRWLAGVLGTVASIALILLVGVVLRFLLHRAINALTERIATGDTGVGHRAGDRPEGRSRWHRARATALLESPLAGERRAQRARTIGSVLKSISTGVIGIVVLLMVLSEFGVNVGPLIAGAGVLGVALGFGSQTLVKDFLSGIFMILEDQYGVGDVVDLGEATGSVEAVGLRVTRLRDVNGTVWYVRNGEILRVGNQSQGWARAVLDVAVAYGENISRVQDLLRDIAHDLFDDPEWSPLVMEQPEVWGVEALSADSVIVRLVVKTVPLEQWKVAREMRRRIKARFDREGIEMPFPQRTVWLRQDEGGERPAAQASGHPPQERPEPPTTGEMEVLRDIDKRSDKGM